MENADGPSAKRGWFGGQSGAAPLFYIAGQVKHGFQRDDAALAPGQRCLGVVGRSEYFESGAFAARPKGQGFRDYVLFAMEGPL